MTLTLNQYIYAVATQGVSILAEQEAVYSYLPGRVDGPADAYRHILLAAELTRQFGETYANTLLNSHEFTGNHSFSDPQTLEANAMDLYNNQLGIEIGKRLAGNPNTSWDDVILETRKLFDPNNNNGNGARWLDVWDQDSNPTDDTPLKIPIPNGDPRLNWPVEWKDGAYYDYPSSLFDKWFKDGVNDLFDFLGNIRDDVNDLFTSAKNWSPPRADPLVLDLDGDGIETTGIGAGTVLFDHDGDGIKTATGWVVEDDGMLVLDRNGNGTIDNGGELFGDRTIVNGEMAYNGFLALSAEDSNKNGKFDAGDTNFTNVRIWQDKNQDGISQSTELMTLKQAEISSINLTFTVSNMAYDGNIQLLISTYAKTDGTSNQVGNYLFSSSAFYREFTDHLPLTNTALTLPDMQGSGLVRDLQEASTLSASLTSTLQEMKTTYMTHDEMMAKLDIMLAQWADTSSMLSGRERANAMGGDVVYMNTFLSQYELYHKYLWAQQHNNYSILTADELKDAQNIIVQQNKLGDKIDVLERFNASGFSSTIDMFEGFYKSGVNVQINTSQVLEGHPNTAYWVFTSPMQISLSNAQAALIEQSYVALKESVYAGLILQTRLNHYIDALDVIIDADGMRIDDSGMMSKLMTLLSTDPQNAMIDMIEIHKYAGATLNILGWNGDLRIQSVLEAVDGKYDATGLLQSYGMIVADGIYYGNENNECILGKQRNDVINAGEGNNKILGGSGNDSLTSGSGKDIIDGGTGSDTMTGGLGNDTYYVDNIGDKVIETSTFATEIDTVNSSITYTLGANLEKLTLSGTAAINGTGNALNNTLTGNSGNNILNGGTGSDTMIGGAGNDTYYVDNTGDVVSETSTLATEIDTVNSSVTYTLSANVENLTLTGTAAINGTGNALNNTLSGNSGNNILNGGTGSDTMIGGAGNDTYYVDNVGDAVSETSTFATEIDTVNSSITYTLGANLEKLTLSGTAAINGTGNALNNTLSGNSGNNILNGGTGSDTMIGGAGNDTYYVDNVGDAVSETSTLSTEIDTVNSSVTYILGANVENLTLTGTAAINGTGNALNNTLAGNSGNNVLNGGTGNDIIMGGAGNDLLTGGAGTDIFMFNTALNVSTNVDTVTDFSAVDDTIWLENAIFTKLTGIWIMTLKSDYFASNATGTATDANDYILYNTTTGALSYDADGNGAGAAIQFALLGISTHPTITNADFMVI